MNKKLHTVLITLLLGISLLFSDISASAAIIPTENGENGISGGGAGLTGGKQEVSADAFEPQEFSYTGNVQTWICPAKGTYRLEVWGAEGGSSAQGGKGGQGGYTIGTIFLNVNDILYICVGGAGQDTTNDGVNYKYGGYNGGGISVGDKDHHAGSGGGATHIALNSNRGVLSNYNSYRDEILIVAGGGGGARIYANGGTGGGLNGGSSENGELAEATTGGSQDNAGTGGGFGYGSSMYTGTLKGGSGGGGGWYGGGGGFDKSGAGGSGYISNKLSNSTTYNNVRSGNGYAKITPIEVYCKASGGTSYRSVDNALLSNLPPYSATGVGNGVFSIKACSTNLIANNYLNNIATRDLKAPDGIHITESYQNTHHILSWDIPESNGTEYEFKARTYIVDYSAQDGLTLIMDTELN